MCRLEDNGDCALYRTKLKLTLGNLDQERKVALRDWVHSSTLAKRQVSMLPTDILLLLLG